jgi:hypothetical protein
MGKFAELCKGETMGAFLLQLLRSSQCHRQLARCLETEQAWKYAYGWRNMARRLWHTAAPWHVAVLTNVGYRHYAYHLHRFYTCDWMTS